MSFLLKEDGDKILQENGDGILLDVGIIVRRIWKKVTTLITKNQRTNLSTKNEQNILTTTSKKTNL